MTSVSLGRNAKVSKELQTALQDDSRRQAIDTAKKKAVGQHVDYDTFKNMVAVAHLRPLQDTNLSHSVSTVPAWSFAPDGQPVRAADAANLRMKAFDAQTCPVPASSGVFLRVWKHQCTSIDSKFELLKQCGPVKLQSLFNINLPGDLLSEILVVLHSLPLTTAGSEQLEKLSQECADSQQVSAEADEAFSRNAELIFDIMKALSGTGRFALTVKLISLEGKNAARGVFLKLRQVSNQVQKATDCELDQLQSAFGLHQ